MPTSERWRVVVRTRKLRGGPIALDAARRVVDVPAFVVRTLADLEHAVAQWNRGRADTLIGRLADEYIEHLRQCGVEVTVEEIQ